MGYTLLDVNGFVANGPTIVGWKELRDKVLIPQGGIASSDLIENGNTELLDELASELEKMEAPTEATQSSLGALMEAVGKAEEVLILSTGVEADPVTDELTEDKAYLV